MDSKQPEAKSGGKGPLLKRLDAKRMFSKKPARVPGSIKKLGGRQESSTFSTLPGPGVPAQSTPPTRGEQRSARFARVLAEENVEMEVLRDLCWGGVPDAFRADCWRILLGYLPTHRDRRKTVLHKRRKEYLDLLAQYYVSSSEERTPADAETLHQIQIDIPRTNPSIPLFQQAEMQKFCERVLYVWAIRHPASGYVQGINDLITPFFIVFLKEHTGEPESCQLSSIRDHALAEVEADTYWCLTKLLDGIQNNYTFAQPGIQRMVFQLREVVHRVDEPLYDHLSRNHIEFLQFAFRWMNCLLLREFNIRLVIRLWDAYVAEPDGLAGLHVYTCAALLHRFSKDLQALEVHEIFVALQHLPTSDWKTDDIEEILAQAYLWKSLFKDSPSHLETLES